MVRILDGQFLERCESCFHGQALRQVFADGRAQALTVLSQRHRQAVHRAGAVQGTPERIEIVLELVGDLGF